MIPDLHTNLKYVFKRFNQVMLFEVFVAVFKPYPRFKKSFGCYYTFIGKVCCNIDNLGFRSIHL